MKMIFMGRKEYSADMIEWCLEKGIDIIAVCTEPDTSDNPVVISAHKHNIPVVSLEEAEKLDCDLAVSYLYSRKIRKPLIEKPTFGCINFHPAILPDWRGTAGYNIAILKKLPQWGATAHYVDESIDTGAIIKVSKFDFDYKRETALTLERKTQKVQMELFKSVVSDVLKNGRPEATKQLPEQGIYISRDEMNRLKRIDLDKDDLDLKIRAFWFPPYDGAFIEVNGKKYTLVNEEILKSLTAGDNNNGAI